MLDSVNAGGGTLIIADTSAESREAKPRSRNDSRHALLFTEATSAEVQARVEEAFWNGLAEGRTDRALFLIAPDGVIFRSNAAAQSLIAKGEFISVIRGHFVCNNPNDHRAFRAILDSFNTGSSSAAALRLEGQLVMTLDRMEPPKGRTLALAVIYETPEFKQQTMELWRDLFKLSPAEARVAEFMRRGVNDITIANLLEITIHTVRGYVKLVHMKTDTNTRAELAHLLSRIDVFRG